MCNATCMMMSHACMCDPFYQVRFSLTPSGSFMNVYTGLCLHPSGGSASPGARLVFWSGCGSEPRLQFNALTVASGM